MLDGGYRCGGFLHPPQCYTQSGPARAYIVPVVLEAGKRSQLLPASPSYGLENSSKCRESYVATLLRVKGNFNARLELAICSRVRL